MANKFPITTHFDWKPQQQQQRHTLHAKWQKRTFCKAFALKVNLTRSRLRSYTWNRNGITKRVVNNKNSDLLAVDLVPVYTHTHTNLWTRAEWKKKTEFSTNNERRWQLIKQRIDSQLQLKMGNETAINFSILSTVASANKKTFVATPPAHPQCARRQWRCGRVMQRQKINEFEAVGACVN